MFSSLRIRLTLWYAAAMALFLALFAVLFYFAFERTVRQIADDSIEDAAISLVTTLQTEKRLNKELVLTDETIAETLRDFRFQNIVFAVFDEQAKPVALSPRLLPPPDRPVVPFNLDIEEIPIEKVRAAASAGQGFETISTAGLPEIRVFVKRAEFERRTLIVAAIRPLTPQLALLGNVRLIMLIGIPFALLFSSAGGYYLARKSLRPVSEIVETAAGITSSKLSERVPKGPVQDELSDLADAFNDMLERLEKSFQQQRRFMADASHELRTPLAIIRGESEVSLQMESRDEGEYRESLDVIRQEGARLSRIVEDLFILARADAGRLKPKETTFYIDELAAECARSIRTLLEAKSQELKFTAEEGLQFTGDEDLIRRLFLNLLDNAVKYSGRGGRIEFSCTLQEEHYAISVANTGSQISESDAPLIFDRFFRSDKARSHTANIGHGTGAGLGLSIGRSIASIHGGSLKLASSDPSWTRFTATLPVRSHFSQNKSSDAKDSRN